MRRMMVLLLVGMLPLVALLLGCNKEQAQQGAQTPQEAATQEAENTSQMAAETKLVTLDIQGMT